MANYLYKFNLSTLRLDYNQIGNAGALALAAVPIVINSDAHSLLDLERKVFGIYTARRGWLERKHVLNTRPVEAVLERRRDRMRSHDLVWVMPTPPAPAPPAEAGSGAVAESVEVADSEPPALVDLLRPPLTDELRERLDAFLKGNDDAELEAALGTLAKNPLQAAFNLVLTAE